MKKRFVSLLMAAMLVSGLLAGCGSKEAPAADPGVTEEGTETQAPEQAEEPTGDNLEASKAIDWQSAKDNAGNPLFIDTFVPEVPTKPENPDALADRKSVV